MSVVALNRAGQMAYKERIRFSLSKLRTLKSFYQTEKSYRVAILSIQKNSLMMSVCPYEPTCQYLQLSNCDHPQFLSRNDSQCLPHATHP